jgi:hypothetical protein
MVFVSCETQNTTHENNTENDDAPNGEAVFKAELSYDGEVFSFDLTGEELPDKVTYLSNQLYFKATNSLQQVLHIKLAGTDLYNNSSGVFRALPALPYAIEENLASITFYDPTEQPLTNASTKYIIDDEVVVSKLTENTIILAYEGDAITGAQLNNTEEGRFNFSLEVSYSDFELQDMRP